jgi:hypothetical protein
MSAVPAPLPEKKQQKDWKAGLSDYQTVRQLMKRMGGRGDYDPLPPDQHKWQRRKGEPPLHRAWSWMCRHTIHWGARNEYAITTTGDELHIEHMAKDLDMDVANAYKAWKEGLALGLWRNGTKEEGRRRRYLCGSVPQPKGEDEAKHPPLEIVCTDNLPPYILKQIKDWPAERREPFDLEWARRVAIREAVLRETVAGARDILYDQDTAFLRQWQLEIRRNEEYKKKGVSPEEIAARRERVKLILPQLELFVQTIEGSVQSGETASYKAENRSAQTGVSLLPQKTTREGPDGRRGRSHDSVLRPVAARQADGGEKHKLVHAGQLPNLSDFEKQAVNLLFFETKRMQEAYPHTEFASERVDPQDKADQIWSRRVLHAVGGENMTAFLLHVAGKFKGLDRNALAKLPSRAPGTEHGPRSLGLILYWAQKFAVNLTEAARPADVSMEDRAEEVRACRWILRSPDASEKAKAIARDTLRAYGQPVEEAADATTK